MSESTGSSQPVVNSTKATPGSEIAQQQEKVGAGELKVAGAVSGEFPTVTVTGGT